MRWLVLAVAVSAAAGCGPVLLEEPAPGGDPTPCFRDSDCVPDGCCGRGVGAVHLDNAPSCAGVACDGSCPREQVQCGCGLPTCREQRCTVALTVGC